VSLCESTILVLTRVFQLACSCNWFMGDLTINYWYLIYSNELSNCILLEPKCLLFNSTCLPLFPYPNSKWYLSICCKLVVITYNRIFNRICTKLRSLSFAMEIFDTHPTSWLFGKRKSLLKRTILWTCWIVWCGKNIWKDIKNIPFLIDKFFIGLGDE